MLAKQVQASPTQDSGTKQPCESSRRANPGTWAMVMPLAFWVCSFSSILLLLLHLRGLLRMSSGVWCCALPAAIAMLGIALLARRAGSKRFRQSLVAGLTGGLIGTLGYDLFRIPFHNAGMNVFSPIYAYGMWCCGYSQATAWSDAVGFAYHLSNGITFGWIYSILFFQRSWWWALGWALALETLAVATVFGEVFMLRSYSGVLVIAYLAHVFYGIPLGLICQWWGHLKGWQANALVMVAIGASVLMSGWFVQATEAIGSRPGPQADAIVFSDNAIASGWYDFPEGRSIQLVNTESHDITVLVRGPLIAAGGDPAKIRLEGGGNAGYELRHSGIYQFGVDAADARSVFVSVYDKQGSYRPNGSSSSTE